MRSAHALKIGTTLNTKMQQSFAPKEEQKPQAPKRILKTPRLLDKEEECLNAATD